MGWGLLLLVQVRPWFLSCRDHVLQEDGTWSHPRNRRFQFWTLLAQGGREHTGLPSHLTRRCPHQGLQGWRCPQHSAGS